MASGTLDLDYASCRRGSRWSTMFTFRSIRKPGCRGSPMPSLRIMARRPVPPKGLSENKLSHCVGHRRKPSVTVESAAGGPRERRRPAGRPPRTAAVGICNTYFLVGDRLSVIDHVVGGAGRNRTDE